MTSILLLNTMTECMLNKSSIKKLSRSLGALHYEPAQKLTTIVTEDERNKSIAALLSQHSAKAIESEKQAEAARSAARIKQDQEQQELARIGREINPTLYTMVACDAIKNTSEIISSIASITKDL